MKRDPNLRIYITTGSKRSRQRINSVSFGTRAQTTTL